MANIIHWPLGENPYYEQERDCFSILGMELRMERLAVEANELEERAVSADDAGADELAGELYAASIRKWVEYRRLAGELDDYESGFWR